MRQVVIFVVVIAFFPCFAFGAEYLEKVESDVFEASGSKQEIAKRGKLCISSIVRNEEVRISDSTASTGPLASAGEGHSGGITGGDVFVDVDIEAGTITVNNRVDYTSKLLAHNIKSTMMFFVKDGRFKIQHANIEQVQKNTEYMHNTGYMRVGKWWGSGWKDAEKALTDILSKVAECVINGPKEDW